MKRNTSNTAPNGKGSDLDRCQKLKVVPPRDPSWRVFGWTLFGLNDRGGRHQEVRLTTSQLIETSPDLADFLSNLEKYDNLYMRIETGNSVLIIRSLWRKEENLG
jgi:hypothetical protein